MSVKICCLKCGNKYFCGLNNTKLYEPTIETTCPTCHNNIIRNFSAFLFDQLEFVPGKLEKARAMIYMSQLIARELDSNYASKRNVEV